jgi:hypothetical protein
VKILAVVIVLGLIPIYLMDVAFRIDTLTSELLIHGAIRFFTGFFLIGIVYFYEHKIKLKSLVYLILAMLLADDIWDYFRNVDSFKPEIQLYGAYVLLWGSLVGYISMRQMKRKIEKM